MDGGGALILCGGSLLLKDRNWNSVTVERQRANHADRAGADDNDRPGYPQCGHEPRCDGLQSKTRRLVTNVADARNAARRTDARSRHARRPLGVRLSFHGCKSRIGAGKCTGGWITMVKKKRVALVGGGLGGMTAALALSRRGLEAHVFEQAGELREIGAGVGIGPNAVKVLRALGLEQSLRARGFEAEMIVGRDLETGETKFRVPMKGASEARYGAAHVQIHRADLLDIMVNAATDVQIHLNSRCV